MPTASRRTLTLFDGMILVAASAVGLSVFLWIVKSVLYGPLFVQMFAPPPQGWTTGQVLVRGVQWIGFALPFACAWTCTVPILRMRAPRPRVRRGLSQPGVAACVASLVALVWASIALGGTLAVDRLASDTLSADPRRWLFHFIVEELFAYVGLAVASTWAALLLAGRWRRSADWIDRFGRILGAFWIASGLVWACRRYLWIVVT
jgi:hypothetical protein